MVNRAPSASGWRLIYFILVGLLIAAVSLYGLNHYWPKSYTNSEIDHQAAAVQDLNQHECKTGITFRLTSDKAEHLQITPANIVNNAVVQTDSWKSIPLYFGYEEGLPEPIPIEWDHLSIDERMLIDGFCSRQPPGRTTKYRHITPLLFAYMSILLSLENYNQLPSGEYGLLFPDLPPGTDTKSRFMALPAPKQLFNAISFYNPIKHAILQVNPPTPFSPGDIHLEYVELNATQLTNVNDFCLKRKADPSRAYKITVYGLTNKPILRGLLFVQSIKTFS